MSYITAMAVSGGIIVSADRQRTQTASISPINIKPRNDSEEFILNVIKQTQEPMLNQINSYSRPITKTDKKLFTIGDNIGLAMGQTMHTSKKFPVNLLVSSFCKKNNFNSPKEAAEKLLEYLRNKDPEMDTIILLAGYDKTNEEYPLPEMYHISVKNNAASSFGNLGFLYAGNNDYFKPYSDRINQEQSILDYSLQDAVDICQLATHMSRELDRLIDFRDTVSEDIEIIAITLDGIQWVKKAELELK